MRSLKIQALDRTAPILAMRPGIRERQTHDYRRAGTSSLYAALDITTGKVISALRQRHRAIGFKKFLQQLDREVPEHLDAGASSPKDRNPRLEVSVKPSLAHRV